ncbi:hypothetical protein A1O3_03885 [Capronia epimyces CBS 606.96]|uniref:Zn(2)-C6 fungal-type domain-containing protein n=1 Tax=Capronia epimyces CBS 606.96 TaxID=1182542 RepID=W9YCG7_9EURO|nr:uncharacterized protein A1O3_03885 [Capronia epimyces CBS 606.96]EXJ86931.1 hypothetical protein A1O3_03885 [Capronia epimyces CBS 606.96]
MVSGSNAVRARDKYTSRACNECQRRKRRCSGDPSKVCRNCRQWATECVFSETRPRRGPNNLNLHLNAAAARDKATPERLRPGNTARREESTNHIGHHRHELERTTTQAQDESPKAQEAFPSPSPSPCSPGGNHRGQSQTPLSTIDIDTNELSSRRESVFERNTNFMTGTAFFQQIDLLDLSVTRTQGTRPGTTPTKVGGGLGVASNANSHSLSILGQTSTMVSDIYRDIDQTVEQARGEDASKIQQALDIFFANVQPHYPCMNEAHLRGQFSAFMAHDSNQLSKNGAVQVAAFLSFIMAVVSILSDASTPTPNPTSTSTSISTLSQDEQLPGWREFCRGEKLLSHASWLEKANMVTVQTLVVKTLYFMYVGLLSSAYDTMGTTVRVCFQLGLHNEPSWGEDCSFYDRTYRQRLFWSVFCLNHNAAQTRGIPDLLRPSDFNVGLPKCVNDRMLYPHCPASLPEMPALSPVPYLLETIKLTSLSSQVWEAMFGARAQKPVSQDFIAAMDDKILALARDIPSSLRWPPPNPTSSSPSPSSAQQSYYGPTAPLPFILQQGFILHLRILYLRMLLRREEMINLTYGEQAARLCIDVTAEVVAAVEASYPSQRSNRCTRHAYLHHLTGAIVPMICIVIRQTNGEDLTRPATNLLTKCLKILESFSQRSFLARRVLQQLRRPIQVARDIIDSRGLMSTCTWSGAAAASASESASAVVAAAAANTATTTTTTTSSAGPAPCAPWNGGSISNGNGNSNNHVEWDLSLPSIYQDPFQDVLSKPPVSEPTSTATCGMAFLLDDASLDLWNSFNWSA